METATGWYRGKSGMCLTRSAFLCLCVAYFIKKQRLIRELCVKELCTTKYVESLIVLMGGVTPIWRAGQELVSHGLVSQDSSCHELAEITQKDKQ